MRALQTLQLTLMCRQSLQTLEQLLFCLHSLQTLEQLLFYLQSRKRFENCSHGESFSEQARFVSFIQEERTVDMGWSRAPDIQGLALEETSAKRFGVCFGD